MTNKKNKNLNTFMVSGNRLPEFAKEILIDLRNEKRKEKVVLLLSKVDKVYENGFQAIFGISIQVEKGEFLSILGPSGCGKTTTLRMIAGLEKVSHGNIFINGLDVTHAEPSSRDLTMVFQNYALFPHLTVKQNLEFGLKANKKKLGKSGQIYKKIKFAESEIKTYLNIIYEINKIDSYKKKLKKLEIVYEKIIKKPKFSEQDIVEKVRLETFINDANQRIKNAENNINDKEKIKDKIVQIKNNVNNLKSNLSNLQKNDNYKEIINKKIEDASKMLGLDYYLNRRPSELSGGQRQRVALGRSIVANPTLFLMDEPLSNLDAKLRAKMRSQIRRIHDQLKTVSVYVTHDQIEAMTMSDKIVVMSDGFVQQIGSPKEIYSNPSNLFVASFVGSPSMNLLEGQIKNKKFISTDGQKINIPIYKLKNAKDGGKVVFGIRPTDFSTDKNIKEMSKNVFKVKIVEKELLGNEIQYKALLGTNCIIFITSAYEDHKIGKEIEIYPLVSRSHLFDKETTIALTSKFNLQTLESLNNWVKSNEKIAVRKKIMEKEKKKANKTNLATRIKNLTFKKKVSKSKEK